MRDIFYLLHVLGMIIILVCAIFLLTKKEIPDARKKKFSLYLMSAAHFQLLTGFILFFLLLSEVNHMKIGIKIMLAISIAILTTIHKKKIFSDIVPNRIILPSIVLSAIIAVLIAFFM